MESAGVPFHKSLKSNAGLLCGLTEPSEIASILAKSGNREPLLRGTRFGHFCCGTEHEVGFNPSSFGRRLSRRRFPHENYPNRSVDSRLPTDSESTLWLLHGIDSSLTQY